MGLEFDDDLKVVRVSLLFGRYEHVMVVVAMSNGQGECAAKADRLFTKSGRLMCSFLKRK